MPAFGGRSTTEVNSMHRDLQIIAREVVKIFDISALQGHRPVADQWELFLKGRELKHPGMDVNKPESWGVAKGVGRASDMVTKIDGRKKKGMHNYEPSLAGDFAPYPIDFRNAEKSKARFYYMAGVFYAVTEKLFEEGKITHKIRWGGDWDFDHDFEDQSFDDLPHIELLKPKK